MKIKSISKFAKAHNLSRQTLEHRIKAGWKFGILDGVKVMYSPKHFMNVIDDDKNTRVAEIANNAFNINKVVCGEELVD